MKRLLFISAFLMFSTKISANNILLNNVSVLNNPTNTGKIIEFDLSWENSWRTASTGNYDGAWVFFKFKDNDGKWYPLRFTGTDINLPGAANQDLGNNGSTIGVGMFIYRSGLGSGTFTLTDVRAGIQSYPGTFEVRGFAIEMVRIPQGSFWVGDSTSTFTYQNSSNPINGPYQVTGNGASITMGNNLGELYDIGLGTGLTLTGFPSGYASFWIMKYELSQGGYRDFLNTLTFAQQENRFPAATPPTAVAGTNISGGGPIEIVTPGSSAGSTTPAAVGCDFDNDNIYNESTDGEWKVYNHTTWSDVASYLDWAGLRPMTDLEFEKACRGPIYPVYNEYAWGNTNIADYAYTLVNSGQASETISNMSSLKGNAFYSGSSVFFARGGIFGTAISTRVSAGAGYYGVMDLSGNVGETTVTTRIAAGRSYTGKHGDGYLTSVGNANEDYWPGVNGNTDPNTATGLYDGGAGVRTNAGVWLGSLGGYSSQINTFLKVSNRSGGSGSGIIITNATPKTIEKGIRGIRDAN